MSSMAPVDDVRIDNHILQVDELLTGTQLYAFCDVALSPRKSKKGVWKSLCVDELHNKELLENESMWGLLWIKYSPKEGKGLKLPTYMHLHCVYPDYMNKKRRKGSK